MRLSHTQKASTHLTEKKDTLAEANAIIAQERSARLEACQKELTALLEKYKAQLSARAFLTPDGRIVATMALENAPASASEG
jgi:hypothetical protein